MSMAGFGVFSTITALVISTIDPEILTQQNAIERLTISGLLAIAVVYLYRENYKLRDNTSKREEEKTDDLKQFIAAQTLATQTAAHMQAEAFSKMASAMRDQQSALGRQVETFNAHIGKILDAATRSK